MSKACQYGTMDDKVFIGLHEVSIKLGQNDVQIALHGPRSLGKVAKSGQRLVLIWVCDHENCPSLSKYFASFYIHHEFCEIFYL
jgi:hypothetical protein